MQKGVAVIEEPMSKGVEVVEGDVQIQMCRSDKSLMYKGVVVLESVMYKGVEVVEGRCTNV